MKTSSKHSSKTVVALVIAASLTLSACADMSPTDRGTATGAGIGAGIGGLLGATTGGGGGGRAAGGAVLGAAAGAIIGNIWSTKMENQKRQMEQATRGTGVQVTQTADNRLKLEIPSDISFDTSRADIKGNFRPVLDRFAASLNENATTTVSIIGYTDSTGSDAINQPLSVERAAHTRDYLAMKGVSPTRIVVEGRGASEPIASNDDNAGRARNRRVEIYVAEPARSSGG
jgi:outer membrane protein OmpA-like peptidoglycan-associated protein